MRFLFLSWKLFHLQDVRDLVFLFRNFLRMDLAQDRGSYHEFSHLIFVHAQIWLPHPNDYASCLEVI